MNYCIHKLIKIILKKIKTKKTDLVIKKTKNNKWKTKN